MNVHWIVDEYTDKQIMSLLERNNEEVKQENKTHW